MKGTKAVKTPGEDSPAWKLEEEEEPHAQWPSNEIPEAGSTGELPIVQPCGRPVRGERVLQRNGSTVTETLEFTKAARKILGRRGKNGGMLPMARRRRNKGILR